MNGLRSVPLIRLLTLLLLAALISQSWSTPKGSFQRRNWTPQAMLYLKGTRMFLKQQHSKYYQIIKLHLVKNNAGTFYLPMLNIKGFNCEGDDPGLFLPEGRRFISEDRKEGNVYDTLHLETRSQNTEKLSVDQAAAVLLNFLQQAREGGEVLCGSEHDPEPGSGSCKGTLKGVL
uniref:Uncharacterized protein n=1 Tax=Nothobranchius furzeri TaxID=105023 RepID=A0A8C6LPR3_NOTFU